MKGNKADAVCYFKLSADRDNPDGQYACGVALFFGCDLSMNQARAVSMLRRKGKYFDCYLAMDTGLHRYDAREAGFTPLHFF